MSGYRLTISAKKKPSEPRAFYCGMLTTTYTVSLLYMKSQTSVKRPAAIVAEFSCAEFMSPVFCRPRRVRNKPIRWLLRTIDEKHTTQTKTRLSRRKSIRALNTVDMLT